MNSKFKKIIVVAVVALAILSVAFMFLISPISSKRNIAEPQNIEMLEANGTTEELVNGLIVEQNFNNTVNNINEIAVVFTRLYYLDEKDANNTIAIELLDGDKILASTELKSNDIPDQHRVYIYPSSPINDLLGEKLTLKIYDNSGCDTGVSLMINTNSTSEFRFGNRKQSGSICFSVMGEN